ncbi:metallophosphoesterase [candidate division KSB1 bacterium]|nr:metallophosphoesterase [candidate division KSB1 bacterium]
MAFEKWSFVHVADMQPGSPKSYRFKPAFLENWHTAREQIMEIQPEFMLIGGDITRDGNVHKWELEEMKADFNALSIPYHVIPGNMDTGNKHTNRQGPWQDRDDISLNITSEQVQQFASVFGPLWWSFVHKNLRVSGFCDMLLGSGLPEETALWQWLANQRNQPPAKYHIWIMHYALFINELHEPNHDIADPDHYTDWYFGIDEPHRSRLMDIFKATNTTRVITAHIHCRKDHFTEGIAFDLAPATCFAQWHDKWSDGDPTLGFLKYNVSQTGIEKTFVPLEKISARTDGYGPGGHPKPEARDYSLAWKKQPE